MIACNGYHGGYLVEVTATVAIVPSKSYNFTALTTQQLHNLVGITFRSLKLYILLSPQVGPYLSLNTVQYDRL